MSFFEDVLKKAAGKEKKLALKEGVPQNREAAAAMLRLMGELRREVMSKSAEMEAKIAKIREDYENDAAPYAQKYNGLRDALIIYAEANRDALTDNGKKQSADLGSGMIKWRKLPPKVTIRGTEQVIDFCMDNVDFEAFVRTKNEPDKEAMLANPELAQRIPGVTIGSEGETVDIEPTEEKTEAAKTVTARKRTRATA